MGMKHQALKLAAITASMVLVSLLMARHAWSADLSCAEAGNNAPVNEAPPDYLSWLQENDLRQLVCEQGRETYRSILWEYHLAFSAKSLRLDVLSDGRAKMTVRETETVISDKQVPKLVLDRARWLTAAELEAFRQKFGASGFWTLNPPEFKPGCVPNGVTIVEVVIAGRYGKREFSACNAGPSSESMRAWFDEINRLDRSLSE
jgi:hypothetical protein